MPNVVKPADSDMPCEFCDGHKGTRLSDEPKPPTMPDTTRRDHALRASGVISACVTALRHAQEDTMVVFHHGGSGENVVTAGQANKLITDAITDLACAQAKLNQIVNARTDEHANKVIPTSGGACQLILETNSGPGKGTPCPEPAIELLHGLRLCHSHSDEVRRVNNLPLLARPSVPLVDVQPMFEQKPENARPFCACSKDARKWDVNKRTCDECGCRYIPDHSV